MPLHEVLTKPTKPPFVSFGSEPDRKIDGEKQTIIPMSVTAQPKEDIILVYLRRNPYPQGTPEAKVESLRVVAAARRGGRSDYENRDIK